MGTCMYSYESGRIIEVQTDIALENPIEAAVDKVPSPHSIHPINITLHSFLFNRYIRLGFVSVADLDGGAPGARPPPKISQGLFFLPS